MKTRLRSTELRRGAQFLSNRFTFRQNWQKIKPPQRWRPGATATLRRWEVLLSKTVPEYTLVCLSGGTSAVLRLANFRRKWMPQPTHTTRSVIRRYGQSSWPGFGRYYAHAWQRHFRRPIARRGLCRAHLPNIEKSKQYWKVVLGRHLSSLVNSEPCLPLNYK